MKVDYLFSRNKKIGSRLIAWASSYEDLKLEHYPSHVAVLLNETWVIESTFTSGVRVVPYESWGQINEELYKIPCNKTYRRSGEVMEKATGVWNKKYDWLGIMYFAGCFIALIMFDKKMPKENKWQDKKKYFCTEYAGLLTNAECSMMSPARMCKEWMKDDV